MTNKSVFRVNDVARTAQIYHRVLIVIVASCLSVSPGRLSAETDQQSLTRPLIIQDVQASITESTVSGPLFRKPVGFHSFESSKSPRIKRLRDEYELEDVVGNESDEFRRILLLRHWVSTRWPIDNKQQFSGDAFEILEKAKNGSGFQCSHSMRVQHAVLTAMGFVTRDLGVDRDHAELGSGHHGVNEVWSNQYAKWILVDAKYDIHFERAGVPLSALELHEAVRSNQTGDILKSQGPDRQPVPMKGPGYPESNVLSYWWVSYHVALDHFTGSTRDSRLVVFDNEPFRQSTWYRAGKNGLKKHWAYAAKSFIRTPDRGLIQWTPGVPKLQIQQISSSKLEVMIESLTPNFKANQVRINRGTWQTLTRDRYRWDLVVGENRIDVRTQNTFGVNSPNVTAALKWRPDQTSTIRVDR